MIRSFTAVGKPQIAPDRAVCGPVGTAAMEWGGVGAGLGSNDGIRSQSRGRHGNVRTLGGMEEWGPSGHRRPGIAVARGSPHRRTARDAGPQKTGAAPRTHPPKSRRRITFPVRPGDLGAPPFPGSTNTVTRNGGQTPCEDHPPSTGTVTPVMNAAASLARKSAVPAISSGRPHRPIGVRSNI